MQEERHPELSPSKSTVLENPEFEYKLLRQLGLSIYGGATVGECYSIAESLRDWDPEQWTHRWAELASGVEEKGRSSLERGHHISARESFLRATTYYHAAEYFALISNGPHTHYGLKCIQCFEAAFPLLDHYSESVSVEADQDAYPCYFFAPDDSGKKRKTIMLIPGVESCGEEQYFYAAVGALKRGYNVFIFQGPGQTGHLRDAPERYLCHDYEVPLQIALDYLCGRSEVDTEKLAVMGTGLGSYFASRLVVFDKRVKALAVNPPFVNVYRSFLALIGSRATNIDFTVSDIKDLPASILRTEMKLFILHMCRRFGATRLQELLRITQKYTSEDMLYRITCPTIVLHGETVYPELDNQAKTFMDKIHSERMHTESIHAIHVADAHTHIGNLALLNQLVYDWMDELF